MPCDENQCECSQGDVGQYLTQYINLKRSTCSNIQKNQDPSMILKPYAERNSSANIKTRAMPHIFFIQVPFTCHVKITSLIIKSTFKEIKIFGTNDASSSNWKYKKPFEHSFLPIQKHFVEIKLKHRMFKDIEVISVALFGNESEEQSLYYMGFKGTFEKTTHQPIVTKYEVYSSETVSLNSKTEPQYRLY
ncbi:hypothetical protein EDEG_01822 [Edhazardia aedis USNM 41457]|uniref:PITH domain-containing protein n=1 Tax=Edhazardia aedis (strain USNM 41457) TaxID=1003232 RepID=J9DMT8_EDHAE|nr:hypothetical protein EDEG_01822 [Edhazardia aedis USNM 41457]|eukprot:EJW03885.1 hypothetical protein EDEG_01822 [Edhazardia aedis USNM 41457]